LHGWHKIARFFCCYVLVLFAFTRVCYLSINFSATHPHFLFYNALQAYHLGMFGSDYAWILQGSPKDVPWWSDSANTVCSPAALMAAVEGLLLVSSHNSLAGPEPSLSGLVS
jgi:hypothetical protein